MLVECERRQAIRRASKTTGGDRTQSQVKRRCDLRNERRLELIDEWQQSRARGPMVRIAVVFSSLCVLASATCSAVAQVSVSPIPGGADRFRAPGAEIECGPIGCRPLPPGCRQVSLGGRWIDNNGRRVVCDKKGRTSR
jgi:hypothetical protein